MLARGAAATGLLAQRVPPKIATDLPGLSTVAIALDPYGPVIE